MSDTPDVRGFVVSGFCVVVVVVVVVVVTVVLALVEAAGRSSVSVGAEGSVTRSSFGSVVAVGRVLSRGRVSSASLIELRAPRPFRAGVAQKGL